MATQAKTQTFNFASYNLMMDSANSGLKLYLALQNLQDVESTFRRYDSPFSGEMIDIVNKLTKLRADNKAYLESRQANQESLKRDNTTSGALDNQHVDGIQHTTSADAGKITA